MGFGSEDPKKLEARRRQVHKAFKEQGVWQETKDKLDLRSKNAESDDKVNRKAA